MGSPFASFIYKLYIRTFFIESIFAWLFTTWLVDRYRDAHESPPSWFKNSWEVSPTSCCPFCKQSRILCVCACLLVCVCLCVDGVIQKLFHLHGNASLPILPLSLPRSGVRLPSLGPVVKVTQHAPGWQAGRQAEGEGAGSIFIVPGPPYASWYTRPWVVPGCCMRPGEQAADLIFQHTAAPTSGPGEGDLPWLLEFLLKWRSTNGVLNPKCSPSNFWWFILCCFNFRSAQLNYQNDHLSVALTSTVWRTSRHVTVAELL